jgi:hypothetical protein
MRWHHVLPYFQEQLLKLKHFSMGRGPVGHASYGEPDLSADEAFDDRYSLTPCIDSSRYAIFDFGEGAVPYESPRFDWHTSVDGSESRSSWLERERWTWLDRETEEDLKAKIAYPECLQEDRDALAELLRVVRDRV